MTVFSNCTPAWAFSHLCLPAEYILYDWFISRRNPSVWTCVCSCCVLSTDGKQRLEIIVCACGWDYCQFTMASTVISKQGFLVKSLSGILLWIDVVKKRLVLTRKGTLVCLWSSSGTKQMTKCGLKICKSDQGRDWTVSTEYITIVVTPQLYVYRCHTDFRNVKHIM